MIFLGYFPSLFLGFSSVEQLFLWFLSLDDTFLLIDTLFLREVPWDRSEVTAKRLFSF